MGTLIVNQYLNFDVDATAYIAAVESADGQTLENTTRMAFDRFIKGCKADGIWDAIKASCILAGARTLAGALTPLVGAAPTNYNFVAGDYDRKTGLQGDASTKYLDSNRLENADPDNDYHLSVFVTTPDPRFPGDFNSDHAGVLSSGDTGTVIAVRSDSNAYVFGRSTFHSGISARPVSNSLFAVKGDTAESTIGRVSGVEYTRTFTFYNTASSLPYFVYCSNSSGVGTNFSLARMSFFSVGTSVDLSLLESRISQLMTDINNAF